VESGKSLAYIIPIVDHVLRTGAGRGIQAIVAYPMNALANSQAEELSKFLGKENQPVRFARYTGQEKADEKNAIRANPPDVLLTNYMMLELMLTRSEDRELVRAAQGLKFLVFDELHTYRGRQAHIHAVWMEVAKPDLGKTLMAVLDIKHEDGKIHLLVNDPIHRELVNPVSRATALSKANKLVDGIREAIKDSTWFHDDWTKEVLEQIERSFDSACERWRDLYRSAVRQRELHHKIIGDHSRPEPERSHSRRLRAQAESQIKLLTEAEGIYEGDFYSYRYFAAEGFLPGYNFPRLPISAFVPARRGRKGRDEFVSRPRFLAISEFGPRSPTMSASERQWRPHSLPGSCSIVARSAAWRFSARRTSRSSGRKNSRPSFISRRSSCSAARSSD
jgi:hypothetical protein